MTRFQAFGVLGWLLCRLGGTSAWATLLDATRSQLPSNSVVRVTPHADARWVRQPWLSMIDKHEPGPGQSGRSLKAAVRKALPAVAKGSLVATLALRGGVSIAANIADRHVLSECLAELNNIRTPAALIAGAALGTMFANFDVKVNKRLHLLYTIMCTSAFALQLVAVLCSTITITSISSLGHAVATSSVAFLMENFELEWLLISMSFGLGMLIFCGAMTARAWLVWHTPEDRKVATSVTTILSLTVMCLLNIYDSHAKESNTLTLPIGYMLQRIAVLMSDKLFHTPRFLRHVIGYALCWVACRWWISRSATAPVGMAREEGPQPGRKTA